jgi:hypothetical protein
MRFARSWGGQFERLVGGRDSRLEFSLCPVCQREHIEIERRVKRLDPHGKLDVVDGAFLIAAIVQDIAVEAVGVSTTRTVRNGLSAGLQRLVETPLDQIGIA